MLPSYAELHCLSNCTFLRGASDPAELIQRASVLGYSAIAITDECSVSGMVRAHLAARDCAMKLIVGSEFRLDDGAKVLLLAANRNGYANLSEIISVGRCRARKGTYHLTHHDFENGAEDCLLLMVPDEGTDAEQIRWWKVRFPECFWIAAELLRGQDDSSWLAHLKALSSATGVPLAAAGDVHMHMRDRKALQDVMTAIRLGCPVAELGRELFPNSERHLRSLTRLAGIYPPELMAETLSIAARCDFSLEELRYEYPEELVPAGETPASHLRKLTYAGMRKRYPQEVPQKAVAIVERELALIGELRYEAFFLTVHDVVCFAREQKILCQGRGSAANSAVCYCLGITEVDPARMEVLFERFISRERNEPPDIDVDFEHERREEVIQYIYRKYGRERTALAAELITYRPKSALRDVGKALGLAQDQVDRLSRTMAWWDRKQVKRERLIEAGFDPDNPVLQQIVHFTHELIGFPRHLSQHVGGFVIARDKLSCLVPIENAAMPERTVIQWDKDDLEALGLLKVDVLALGMLTAIRRTLDTLNKFHGTALGMADIPPEDAKVYDMICHADTIGVFQIESRAQMSMLPRLRPNCFYDLVIEVAIVRPGPIQGGMVHPYLRRRQGLEPVTYPSEKVRAVVERTLGVSIFQEQVMQLAVVAAGFTPGEADQLRRAMAAWKRKGGLEPFREKLIAGMLARGYQAEYVEQIYQQIKGFGEYGFPESHAASFALLAYVSAWLKYHHPAAFACGLLNSQPMGFYSPSQIVQDARRHGVEVFPVDILQSEYDSSLEKNARGEAALRLGLHMVGGLSHQGAKRIVAARAESPLKDLDDLARRANLNARDLNALAAGDALQSLSGHRRQAYWQTLGIQQGTQLIPQSPRESAQPELLAPSEGENVILDYASLGLTLRKHPLALLRRYLGKKNLSTAEQLRNAEHGQFVRTTGIVTCRQRPSTASGVVFITLEDETGYINVVVWSSLADKQRKEMLASKLLTVRGKIEKQGEVIHLIATRLIDDSHLLGKLSTSSRDFH
jgi:error-prone DNA polymerase